MRDVLYLARRYLQRHRALSTTLVAALTLIVFLPVGLRVLVSQSERELGERARMTPLMLGQKGSALELVLNGLYFTRQSPPHITYEQVERIEDGGLALALPLHTQFRVGQQPIVGTVLEYFDFRELQLQAGRGLALLGECVLGAKAAASLGVQVGDHVISASDNVFDLAGVYPLKMPVVGVLAIRHTPDDEAVFVDLRTAWVIAGLGHGHQDLNAADAQDLVLERNDAGVVANRAVVEYNEITADNVDTFHFHGDTSTYPVHAVIAVPEDARAAALLQGRYVAADEPVQIVKPTTVVAELLDTVLTVQAYVLTAVFVVGGATVATAVLLLVLSVRLRRAEIETMLRIGASRGRIGAILATEILVILGVSGVFAALLTLATATWGTHVVRAVILG